MLSRHLSTISKRAASAAAVKSATESVTTLPNGLTVATIDQHGAASQIVVAFRAGSRYETSDNQGVVHVLRNSIGISSQDFTADKLLWNTVSAGGQISTSSTRDVFAVKVAANRDNAIFAASLAGELANPKCEPWDIVDPANNASGDITYRCKRVTTIDNLHRAAFRNGNLGNSNFVGNTYNKGAMLKKVPEFKEKYFRAGNAVVVGINVDHNALVQTAEGFRFPEGKAGTAEPSKYIGGEIRVDAGGPNTIVAIGGEGAALNNIKDVAAQYVAAEILAKLAQKAGVETAEPVNAHSSDAGLVGVVFYAEHAKIGQFVKSVANAVKNAKTDDAAVSVARRTAALKVLTAGECSASLAVDGAVQYLTAGSIVSPAEFAEIIGGVSVDAVNKSLSKISSKLSLSSYGCTREVPHLDEL